MKTESGGPLAPCVPGFRQYLEERGFEPPGMARQLELIIDLGDWMAARGLDAVVPVTDLESFFAARVASGKPSPTARRGLRCVLGFLRQQLPDEVAELDATGRLVAEYRTYLTAERGLCELTIGGYLQTTGRFLAVACGGDPERLGSLAAGAVASFVIAERDRGTSPRTVNEVVVRLRAFFRFAYLRGLTPTRPDRATPWMADSRAGSLPRGLEPAAAQRLLASCDTSTLVGLRDRAILSVFVRLGLRCAELVALTLDDLDWRHGEVMVRGKAENIEVLPLPSDVGEALASYLVARGPTAIARCLFLTVKAPIEQISATAVHAVVRRACGRTGIPPLGTHRFRHAVASELLARGAPLPEIGQLLRHHHLQTTAIYASVDMDALAPLAQPWPGATQ